MVMCALWEDVMCIYEGGKREEGEGGGGRREGRRKGREGIFMLREKVMCMRVGGEGEEEEG